MTDQDEVPQRSGEEPDVAAVSCQRVQAILDAGSLDATATAVITEPDSVTVNVTGPDASLLIGRHGQVLDALQYLVMLMLGAKTATHAGTRVTLDVEGYRERRADALRRLAENLARQVRETGEEAVLEPLSAFERRIVHTVLMSDDAVETYSEGQDPNRHIVITPKRPPKE